MEKLEIKGIHKSYNGVPAVDGISFTISKGKIIGLLGPNGAGKTTTMSIITGIIAADKGEVLFDSQKMDPENEIAIKQKIGFLSEANPLYPEMFVIEYLRFMGGLRGMEKQELENAINRVAKETGIEDKLYQPIEELSKGYKQRVGLAQAILHEPELLILDEPTEGLDPNQRVTIRDLIESLGKERTVIISTHVLSEVQSVCDDVIILNKGKVVTQGSVDAVINDSKQGQKVFCQMKGSQIREKLTSMQDWTVQVKEASEGMITAEILHQGKDDIRPKIFELAKQNDWVLYELHQERVSLEDTFRQLTSVSTNQK